MDLHATGRTIYYVKSVLEYFAERDDVKLDSVDGFVGYGRGQEVGLPKISHVLPDARVNFADVVWPFSMMHRNLADGISVFSNMHSRYIVLLHAYHSLRLFNEAVNYFRKSRGMTVAVEMPARPIAGREQSGENIILRVDKQQFLEIYSENGYFRPGFFGKEREAISQRLNEWFGEGGWETRCLVEGRLEPRQMALELYEDAYVEFFKAHPEILDWLVQNAKDVYDNSLSNIESGIDYDSQESSSHHYQDIAIRRALTRLGRKFEGDEYIQIRGSLSRGYGINPGLVPFHRKGMIPAPQLTGWWKEDSIEAFYQSSKVIVIKDSEVPAAHGVVLTLSGASVRRESEAIHAENPKFIPNVPDKTILCHIIADSILPVGQKSTLKTLEQDMRDEKYNEKVIAMPVDGLDDPESFIMKLEQIKAREEARYEGYRVQFDVACPERELVERVQKFGVQALAFTKEADGEIVQIEGIVLALRALQTGSAANVLRVYKLLTGNEMKTGVTDIDELARTILFVLPVRKVDVGECAKLNELIKDNIKTAA